MKWKKLGKIFDPTQYTLPLNCTEFAQSPQTLVFDDFVRIYFSTRQKDPQNGKYLSHIAFIDMDKEFKQILNTSSKPVIELGGLGTFDEHGIFPINPLRHGDKVWAYTCGWSRRVSVSVETSTGLAVSEDNGETFQKLGSGPVFSSSLQEPFLVGDSFVQVYDGVFHMWYIYGLRWVENNEEEPARVYKIAHAISNDGISWQRDGRLIIADKLDTDECQALPSVVFHEGRYHMVFCYRHATGFRTIPQRGYHLGYAFSDNLVDWTRDDDRLGIIADSQDWDGEMMCYPHIFNFDGKIYLLYNGNAFGKYGFGLAMLEEL
jgi:hypothetical protein